MKINSAIVTGATGMIARAIIRTLTGDGVKVFALMPPGFPPNDGVFENPLVTCIDCDIRDYAFAKDKIGEKCDALFHLAWLGTFGGGRDDAYLQNDNIRYTIDACRLAHDLGCEVFVGAGSQAEYGRVTEKLTPSTSTSPETGYGIAKFAAGKLSKLYCDAVGIRHCWTRILSVYGIGMNPNTLLPSAISTMLRGERAVFTKGEQEWDFLYCDDCARAFYLIAQNGVHGKTYPIGSGKTRLLSDFIKMTRDAVDPSIEIGLGEREYNPGQVMYLCSDNTELYADTGFEPQIPFESGIRLVVDEIKRSIK